jgi:riboflavin kinase/FMN adenylyltransferase
MKVEEELARLSPKQDMMLTIGVFDGVHLGHKYLISQLKEHARQHNLLSGVVTFRQHPQAVLSPQNGLLFLTDPATRTSLLQNEGVDAIITLSFTRELARLSAREFVGLLKKYLRMRRLLVGPNFTLGQNQESDSNALRALGQDMNFSLVVIPPIVVNGAVVSSTAIRNALANGDMERVLNLTGRPFSLHGRITRGTGRGLELGFPTANLDIDPQQALPTDGVYATLAYIDDKVYKSMTNIGQRPTFGDTERTVEVHILDYHNDLLGRELKIDIIKRLRGEKQFDTAQQLGKQIAEDIKQGRAILDS